MEKAPFLDDLQQRLSALVDPPTLCRLPQLLFHPGSRGPDPAGLGAQVVYDISLRYAPTPQAKGKSEREHQYWQGRLPPYFASEKIDQIHEANPHIDDLRSHRNAREVHRELRQTPQRAWDQAQKEGRSVIHPAPRCAWWDYVWSVRTVLKGGPDGRVPIGTQRLRIERPPATKIVLCLHPTGHQSVMAAPPDAKEKPVLLFTNRQQWDPGYQKSMGRNMFMAIELKLNEKNKGEGRFYEDAQIRLEPQEGTIVVESYEGTPKIFPQVQEVIKKAEEKQ